MIVSLDIKEFTAKVNKLTPAVERQADKAMAAIANEALRLSTFEVPHDTGQLQTSGTVQPEGKEYLVGYNKTYAARLHEHPEYRFQKGRKGKYLEDPIKNNMKVFQKYFADALKAAFNG